MITHYQIQLKAKARGYHIITEEVTNHLSLPKNGILFIFLKHTSAGICINEDADPSVRVDFESIYNEIVPENLPYLTHTVEGPDDMPAHIKASMIGTSLHIPIIDGKLDLGTWQGIYLCEFRNRASGRKLTLSIYS